MGRKSADTYQGQNPTRNSMTPSFIVGRQHMNRFVSGFFRRSGKNGFVLRTPVFMLVGSPYFYGLEEAVTDPQPCGGFCVVTLASLYGVERFL